MLRIRIVILCSILAFKIPPSASLLAVHYSHVTALIVTVLSESLDGSNRT